MKATLAIPVLLTSCLFLQLDSVHAQQRGGAAWLEEFEDNRRNWTLIQSKRLSSEVAEGQLWLRGNTGFEGNLFAVNHPLPLQEDFTLSLSLTHHSGQKNMAFGLVWGAKLDERDLFAFLITVNGKYTILKKQRGRYDAIKHWTESQWVFKSGEQNELTIERKGEQLHFYLNEVLVFTGPYESSRGDRVGVLFHGKMKLSIDSLELKLSE
ncbi:MAG: hypothetical protein AAF399_19085 [Bacteroidota bacterium]